MMRPLRSAITLIPTVLALSSFLLPSGLAICIGPDGHVAIELVSQGGLPCCDAPATSTGAESCVPESGSPCEDIALNSGAARLGRSEMEAGPSSTANWFVTLPGMTLRTSDSVIPPQSAVGASSHRSPASLSTILRC